MEHKNYGYVGDISMVMKKASGDDSPLRNGVGKSFWTLPILGQ
jgi:hypothetical protein